MNYYDLACFIIKELAEYDSKHNTYYCYYLNDNDFQGTNRGDFVLAEIVKRFSFKDVYFVHKVVCSECLATLEQYDHVQVVTIVNYPYFDKRCKNCGVRGRFRIETSFEREIEVQEKKD